MEQQEKKIFSLYHVMQSIQRTISDRYKSSFWVKAEMNKLGYYKHSGHCYPELVEKWNGKVVAQSKGMIWSDAYQRINKKFLEILNEPLKDGIKILFEAKITFEPLHGLTLTILDVDPAYTLGDIENEKADAIKKLKQENLYEKNKQLLLPLLPQRIAVISVETSKGYLDFRSVIDGNKDNYRFEYKLYPALLQGDNAIRSIMGQLANISMHKEKYDLVAIIRGGGGDVGLSCYNNYMLARQIATFPLPVFTGIGHSTNETVVEMVSYQNSITPTKLAETLIQKFHDFAVPVANAEKIITERSLRLLKDEKGKFASEIKLFRSAAKKIFSDSKNVIKECTKSVVSQSKFIFKNENEEIKNSAKNIRKEVKLFCTNEKDLVRQQATLLRKDVSILLKEFRTNLTSPVNELRNFSLSNFKNHSLSIASIEKEINAMSPLNVLKRGYSITLRNGKAVKNSSGIREGEVIETKLYEGTLTSTINTIKKESKIK